MKTASRLSANGVISGMINAVFFALSKEYLNVQPNAPPELDSSITQASVCPAGFGPHPFTGPPGPRIGPDSVLHYFLGFGRRQSRESGDPGLQHQYGRDHRRSVR